MHAEIVGVGTELLLGQIANTNAQRISEALATIGVDVFFHTTVGDNLGRMTEVLKSGLDRSDVVIITGGLGPTSDDITREAISAATGRPLIRDEGLVDKIRVVFDRLGRDMPESNKRQADVPQGARAISPEGTAPGLIVPHETSVIYALPGVPWEMEAMLKRVVLPELRERGDGMTILSHEIVVMGLGESHTQERILDIVRDQSNPTIAYLAGAGQVRLRITAKASTEAEAIALIDPVERAIRERLGEHAVRGAASSVAEGLGRLLRERGLMIAVAESLTGGLLSDALTRERGSSDYFLGGVVAYATESKHEVLGIDKGILAGPGAVSAEAAEALAEAAARRFGAEVAVSTTGVAGPAEQEGKPVGTIFVGAYFDSKTESRPVRGYGDRTNIRKTAVNAALDLARRVVERSTGDG